MCAHERNDLGVASRCDVKKGKERKKGKKMGGGGSIARRLH